MPYWITLRRAQTRHGFSAATPREALEVFQAKQIEGYEVRVIHPEGFEMTADALALEVDSQAVEKADAGKAVLVS